MGGTVPSMTLNCSHGSVGHKQESYDESMSIEIGWKWDFIEKNTPEFPNSSEHGVPERHEFL